MKPSLIMIILAISVCLPGCTVISRPMMAEALSDVPFDRLVTDIDTYRGETVILGGHVVEVRNEARQTVIVVLQTPLGSGQEPHPPDRSQGRFMLKHEGFLDPEVYAKGRTLTTAGRVIGTKRETIDQEPYDYVVIEARETHLWERREDLYRYHPYRRPVYDPYYRRPWRRYPY